MKGFNMNLTEINSAISKLIKLKSLELKQIEIECRINGIPTYKFEEMLQEFPHMSREEIIEELK